MAQRKVFGRVELVDGSQSWKVELRKDGLWLWKKHHRQEWHLDIATLVRLCNKQPELFIIKEIKLIHDDKLEESQQSPPVPSVPKGQLVPGVGDGNHVHAGVQQQTDPAQVGGDRVDTPADESSTRTLQQSETAGPAAAGEH